MLTAFNASTGEVGGGYLSSGSAWSSGELQTNQGYLVRLFCFDCGSGMKLL